jgi:hypothetical protein
VSAASSHSQPHHSLSTHHSTAASGDSTSLASLELFHQLWRHMGASDSTDWEHLAQECMGLKATEWVLAHAQLIQAVTAAIRSTKSASSPAGLKTSDGSTMAGQRTSGSGSTLVADHAGSGSDWFLFWIAALSGRSKEHGSGSSVTAALDLLSAVSRSPACVYWWPAYGFRAQGDIPRMSLCSCVQHLMVAETPRLWAACMEKGVHPGHITGRWLQACFFGYIPGERSVQQG